MALQLDHVIVCVPDLGSARRDFEADHGLSSIEGGRHAGHGTANRIIPLGPVYLELAAVVDRDEAATSPFGRWVGRRAEIPGADGVCLCADDLDAVADRLGIGVVSMTRVTPQGMSLEWRLAGLEEALARDCPFFIEWGVPADLHPGRIDVVHPAGEVSLVDVVYSGDVDALEAWAPQPAGVSYDQGEPGVAYRLEVVDNSASRAP